MTNNSRKDKMPERPPGPTGRIAENNEDSNDYYLKTQAAAALEKFKGPNKGLEVLLSHSDITRINELKIIFGDDFGLNNVICAADYFLNTKNEHGILISSHTEKYYDEIVKFKPNIRSMLAILKHGKENSAAFLIKVGIKLLTSRLDGGF